MGTLYLVRHGQASFGADDYDQLSRSDGARACGWANTGAQGPAFDAVLTGTLRRHAQTWDGIAEGLPIPRPEAAGALPGLNEYDSLALIAPSTRAAGKSPTRPSCTATTSACCATPGAVDGRRHQPAGHAELGGFRALGVRSALDHVRQTTLTSNVLLVSSGGPISTAVGEVLGTAPEVTIAAEHAHPQQRGDRIQRQPQALMLQTFNTLPHLDHADYKDWVTYA
jgi:broad specificity phosphatase PhoE